jgi:hypothetical protein
MTGKFSQARADRNFDLLVKAACAGERCPNSHPHGPIDADAISALFEAGRIRSEVYGTNFRRVFILVGEHAGKATAPHPRGLPPYLINGRHVDVNRNSWRKRKQP